MHTEPIPFRKQQHVSAHLSTDALGYAWGASINLPSGPLKLRNYWLTSLLLRDICVKKALAVFFCLQAIQENLFNRRVDVFVDNEGLVHAWHGLHSHSPRVGGGIEVSFPFLRQQSAFIEADLDLHQGESGRRSLARLRLERFDSFGLPLATLCLLYTSPSPRDGLLSRMPSSA